MMIEKRKPLIKKSKSPIVLNVARNFESDTKYSVVRFVARRMMGWQLTRSDHPHNWDIMWADSTISAQILSSMKPYQKVNHFPGMYAIARKSNLCMNLNRMKKLYPEDYNFFPKTWFLPAEFSDLQQEMSLNKNETYIVKPEASSQGRGIFLAESIHGLSTLEHSIVQKYITTPFLIDSLKFDMRIYVLLTGCSPLRLFVHEEGLARFATEPYHKPASHNVEDICMHLTNYAVNKKNPKFVSNKTDTEDNVGHKRSLSSTLKMLESMGHDVQLLWNRICDIIAKTICTIEPSLAHTYRSCHPHDISNSMCFEILGFDILIDENLRPWLLEVNHSPAWSTGSPLDKKIKRQVISEALRITNLKATDKKVYEKNLKEEIVDRTLNKKSFEEKEQEREIKRREAEESRTILEGELAAGYIRVVPGPNDKKYNGYMNTAKELWEEFTGCGIRKVSREEPKERPETTANKKIKSRTEEQVLPTPRKPSSEIPVRRVDLKSASNEISRNESRIRIEESKQKYYFSRL